MFRRKNTAADSTHILNARKSYLLLAESKFDSFDIRIEPIYTDDYHDSFDLLNKAQVIAAVANRFNLLRYLKDYRGIEKTPIIYGPVNLYFATTKGKNAYILRTIDEYIREAHSQPDSFFYKAMDKWFGTSIAIDFRLPRWVEFSLFILASNNSIAIKYTLFGT